MTTTWMLHYTIPKRADPPKSAPSAVTACSPAFTDLFTRRRYTKFVWNVVQNESLKERLMSPQPSMALIPTAPPAPVAPTTSRRTAGEGTPLLVPRAPGETDIPADWPAAWRHKLTSATEALAAIQSG